MQVGGGVKPDVLFGLQGDGPITWGGGGGCKGQFNRLTGKALP